MILDPSDTSVARRSRRSVGEAARAFWRRPQSRWFAVVCLALFGYELYAVFVRSSVPDNPPSRETVDVSTADRIAQTIWMPSNGFEAFTLWFDPVPGEARGVVIELHEQRRDGADPLVYRFLVAPRQPHARTRTFRFPAIRDSAARMFRIDLRPLGEGEALPVVANRQNTYGGGALYVNGRERWGDLAFSTTADTATVYGNVRHALSKQMPTLGSPAVLLALFLVYNWAVATFIYYMVFADEREA